MFEESTDTEEWVLAYFPKYGPEVIINYKGEADPGNEPFYTTVIASDVDTMSYRIKDTALCKTDYGDLEGFWVWEGTAKQGKQRIGLDLEEYTVKMHGEWRRPTSEELSELTSDIPTSD